MAALLVLVGSGGARAASFAVDDPGDASDADTGDGLCATATATCTLRAALEQVNALGGAGHTITLPAGTYVQTVTLPTVVVGVTIAGAGAPTTIVQSSDVGHPRLFRVDSGALAMSDLTLTGASIGPGSAIYGLGGDVTLTRCAVAGNAGGAVYGDVPSTTSPAPVITVSSTTFTGNGAGAALTASNYDLVANGCTFDDNHQTAGGLGGGVHLTGFGAGRSHAITASTFTGNTAGQGGGALAIDNPAGTPVTITACSFAGNAAGGNGGGAVFNVTPGLVVTDSSFVDNQATGNGGGILSPQVPFTCRGCTFAGNGATFTGGGVCASGVTFLNGTFSGNTASSGGGIYVDNPFLANALHAGNLTITGNTASGAGGGIGNGQPNVVVKNSIVAGNTAGSGPDCSGTITSQGYNLVGNGTGCGFASTSGDRIGTGAAPIDAGLGVLGSHGGPTQTIPLLAGSPAIDGGNPAGCTDFTSPAPLVLATDQRGSVRAADGDGVGGAVCDVGAYEAPDAPPGSSTTTSTTAVAEATTTSTTLPLPVCEGGVAITGPVLIVRRVAGPAGDESLRVTGSLAFPAGDPSFFQPRDTGAQILIEDLGRGGAPMLELSHRTRAILAGPGCDARDGWTRTRYANTSGRIDPPACTAGSANGLRTLRFKDRRRRGRGITFALTTRRSDLGLPVGPFRTTVVLGATTIASSVGECGTHAFAAAACTRHGATIRCR